MEGKLRDVTRVLSDDFMSGYQAWPVEELRVRRRTAEEVEAAISYSRRIVQGRIDVCQAFEHAEPTEDAMEQVRDALSSHLTSAASRLAYSDISDDGVLPTHQEISELVGVNIDTIVGTPEEIVDFLRRLEDAEKQLSSHRRGLHSVIDTLRQQLVEAYRTGGADVSEVLGNGIN